MLFVSRIKQSISNVTSQNRDIQKSLYTHASVQSKPLSFEFVKAVNYPSDVASHQSSLMTVLGRKGSIVPFMMFMYCLLQLKCTYSVIVCVCGHFHFIFYSMYESFFCIW